MASVLDRMSALDWTVVASVWLMPAAMWLFKTWVDRGHDKLEDLMHHANYSIVGSFPDSLVIRDEGPWDKHPTVTNDAEYVVSELAQHLGDRMLLYVDSMGNVDQLLVKDGRFAGFAPGPREYVDLGFKESRARSLG